MRSGFLEYIQNHAALAGGGKKDFVDKLLARVLKERVEGADDIAARRHHARRSPRKFDKALERVAEVTNALKMMPKGMRFGAGTDDEDIAGVLALFESAIHEGPVDEAAKTQANRDQDQCHEDDAPGISSARTR